MAYVLHGSNLKLLSSSLLVSSGFIAPLPYSARNGQSVCIRPGSEGQVSYLRCHSWRCWSLEEWLVPSSWGHSRARCWSAGSGSSRTGGGGRHPAYRRHHNNAHGSGKGPSASLRECTRTHAPARTAPSLGGCLQWQQREREREVQVYIFQNIHAIKTQLQTSLG